ncbi:MAG: tetratricopeptide repeat protein [Myxococcota bacterium]
MRTLAAAVYIAGSCCIVVGCAGEARYVEQGQLYASQRKYGQAIEQYMMALEENPDSALAHLNIGLVYLATGRFDEAAKAIEESRSVKETDDAIVALSMVHYQQKQYTEAAKLMELALQRSPDKAIHHYRLGLIREQAGDVARAVDAFQMTITQDPGLIDARIRLGLALKQLQRFDEALDVLKEAVRDMRDANAEVGVVSNLQVALGEVYEAMKMNDYAEHSFKLAVKNGPKNGAAIAGLGRIMRARGEIEAAIEMLTAAIRKVPNDGRVRLEIGFAYEEFRLEPQAIESLKKAIELDKRLTGAYPVLLELMAKHNASSTDTINVLAIAAEVMPDDLDIQIRYGKAAYKRKEYAPATEAFEKAIELEPANIEANYYLGLSQAAVGNIDEAVNSANALQYLDPNKAADLIRAIESGAVDGNGSVKKKKKKKKKKKRKKRR